MLGTVSSLDDIPAIAGMIDPEAGCVTTASGRGSHGGVKKGGLMEEHNGKAPISVQALLKKHRSPDCAHVTYILSDSRNTHAINMITSSFILGELMV